MYLQRNHPLKIIRIESGRRRVALSAKQVRQDEWENWMAEKQEASEALEQAASAEMEAEPETPDVSLEQPAGEGEGTTAVEATAEEAGDSGLLDAEAEAETPDVTLEQPAGEGEGTTAVEATAEEAGGNGLLDAEAEPETVDTSVEEPAEASEVTAAMDAPGGEAADTAIPDVESLSIEATSQDVPGNVATTEPAVADESPEVSASVDEPGVPGASDQELAGDEG